MQSSVAVALVVGVAASTTWKRGDRNSTIEKGVIAIPAVVIWRPGIDWKSIIFSISLVSASTSMISWRETHQILKDLTQVIVQVQEDIKCKPASKHAHHMRCE